MRCNITTWTVALLGAIFGTAQGTYTLDVTVKYLLPADLTDSLVRQGAAWGQISTFYIDSAMIVAAGSESISANSPDIILPRAGDGRGQALKLEIARGRVSSPLGPFWSADFLLRSRAAMVPC